MEYTKDILVGENYIIGDYTYGKPNVVLFGSKNKLIIGKFCSINPDSYILLGSEHLKNMFTTYPFYVLTGTWGEYLENKENKKQLAYDNVSKGDIIIGNDVWIGYQSVILSGVKIGDGSIIGARTIISKDVEPYSVMVGNPSICIKKRFDDEIIQKLLEIQWWNWEEDRIKKNINIICSNDIEKLIGVAK